MTHVYLSGHGLSLPRAAGSVDCEVVERGVVTGATFLAKLFFSSPSFFSAELAVEGVPATALAKSNAVPGVLGVFVAEPNEAKAPEPRPKAPEAPVVGEEIPLVLKGVTVLKGLLRPWDDVLPKRFEDVWPSLRSDLSIDRDSLPTLREHVISQAQKGRDSGVDTLYDGTKGCLCPCPLRRLLAVERMRNREELRTEGEAS